jgi:hypothetical protein
VYIRLNKAGERERERERETSDCLRQNELMRVVRTEDLDSNYSETKARIFKEKLG